MILQDQDTKISLINHRIFLFLSKTQKYGNAIFEISIRKGELIGASAATSIHPKHELKLIKRE